MASFKDSWSATIRDPKFWSLSPGDRVNKLLRINVDEKSRFYAQFLYKDCSLVSIKQTSKGTCTATFKFKVDEYYCNGSDNLHGGAQATIFDILTSVALQAIGTPDFWVTPGVSRTLNVTYLRPAPLGSEVLCEVEIVHTGRNLSLQTGRLKRASDGAVLSTCEHNKVAVPVPKL